MAKPQTRRRKRDLRNRLVTSTRVRSLSKIRTEIYENMCYQPPFPFLQRTLSKTVTPNFSSIPQTVEKFCLGT